MTAEIHQLSMAGMSSKGLRELADSMDRGEIKALLVANLAGSGWSTGWAGTWEDVASCLVHAQTKFGMTFIGLPPKQLGGDE